MRAYDEGELRPGVLVEREVHLGDRQAVQTIAADVGDHADDFAPGFGVAPLYEQALSDRVDAWKESVSHGLVDERHAG